MIGAPLFVFNESCIRSAWLKKALSCWDLRDMENFIPSVRKLNCSG